MFILRAVDINSNREAESGAGSTSQALTPRAPAFLASPEPRWTLLLLSVRARLAVVGTSCLELLNFYSRLTINSWLNCRFLGNP